VKFPDDAYTRRAGSITEMTIQRSFPVYGHLKEHFLQIIHSASSFDGARSLLDESGYSEQFVSEDSDLLFEGMSTMDATGRSFVVEKDRFFSEQSRRRPHSFRLAGVTVDHLDVGWFQCADGIVRISFDLIPREVVEHLRWKAFTIASVENDELLKALQAKLIEAVERGMTYSQFQEEAIKLFSSFGIEPLSPRRLQTVFRTNLFTAYSVAQLEQINTMPGAFPLWRYVAILDSSTRPDHRALNGMIFRLGDGPYPPIDYNCRCSAQHIHSTEAAEAGIRPSVSPTLPEGVRRFNVHSDFDRWARTKEVGMNPRIRDTLRRKL
jgi:SPP1 gp7 family putative phage head morphogenesis protein